MYLLWDSECWFNFVPAFSSIGGHFEGLGIVETLGVAAQSGLLADRVGVIGWFPSLQSPPPHVNIQSAPIARQQQEDCRKIAGTGARQNC